MDEMTDEEKMFLNSLGLYICEGWRAYLTARRWFRNVEDLIFRPETRGPRMTVFSDQTMSFGSGSNNANIIFGPKPLIQKVVCLRGPEDFQALLQRLKAGELISHLVMN